MSDHCFLGGFIFFPQNFTLFRCVSVVGFLVSNIVRNIKKGSVFFILRCHLITNLLNGNIIQWPSRPNDPVVLTEIINYCKSENIRAS